MNPIKPFSAFINNPLFATYNVSRKHRFHNYILVLVPLLLYEILILFFRTPHIEKVEGHDLWFQVLYRYLPFHTVILSLTIIVYLLYYLRLDYKGIKDSQELAEEEKKKKEKETYVFNKPKWRFDYIHGLRMLTEAFVFSAILYTFLPFIAERLSEVFAPNAPLPNHLPRQLMDYQTNPIQNIALAFGSGVYEELIFRFYLIRGLNQFFKKRFPPISAFYFIPLGDKNKGFRHKLAAVIVAALIYSFSHFMLPILHPNAEMFTVYNLFYRWFYGIALSYILIKRKFGIAVWTHIFYEIFYFSLY